MYFIGALTMIFGMLYVSYLYHIPTSMFLNVQILLTILIIIVGVIIVTSGFKTFIQGFGAVFSAKYNISDEEREKAAGLFNLLAKAVIIASFINMFFRLIATMAYIEDAERLAHGLAVAFVSPIYGLLISLAVIMPAAYVLSKSRSK